MRDDADPHHRAERRGRRVARARARGRPRAARRSPATRHACEPSSHCELVRGDALTGEGLERALDGIEVAYYLIHSMEPARRRTSFAERDRDAARALRRGGRARAACGGSSTSAGCCLAAATASAHLASRVEVERILLDAVPDSVALRASLVIGARSRSFRAIVRLIERLPVIPLPPWRRHRTQPIDERDAIAYLAAAATAPQASAAGARHRRTGGALLRRDDRADRGAAAAPAPGDPRCRCARRASTARSPPRVSGEPRELLGPLMDSLDGDLLADDAPRARAVRRAAARLRRGGRARAARVGGARAAARPMSIVRSSVVIAAPPRAVWAVVMDPQRLAEWVTIHREVCARLRRARRARARAMEQILHLRGADIRVRWLLVECVRADARALGGARPGALAGARSNTASSRWPRARASIIRTSSRPPFGAVGALASRTVMGSVPQREADRSLAALRALVEST